MTQNLCSKKETKRFGLPLVQDEGYCYVVILSVGISLSLGLGMIRAYGVFVSEWIGSYGSSMVAASYVFTMVTIGSCFNSLVSPLFLKYLGTRRMMVVASVGLSVSQIATSFSRSLVEAQFFIGVLSGFFFNMHFYASNIILQGWLNKKSVFGNGIVFCGVPLGGFILNPLWTYLIKTFSWKSTLIIQAGLSLNLIWLSLLLIECPWCPVNTEKKPFSWSLLKSSPVLTFATSQLFFYSCYSSTVLFFPYLTETGHSYYFAANLVSLQAFSEVIFRPILSYLLNKYSQKKFELMSFAIILTALTLGLTPFAQSSLSLKALSLSQGFSFAFVGGLPTSIIVDLAGYERLPTAFVIYAFVIDSSFMFGPLLYSKLKEIFFIEAMFFAAAGVGLLSLVLNMLAHRLSKSTSTP